MEKNQYIKITRNGKLDRKNFFRWFFVELIFKWDEIQSRYS